MKRLTQERFLISACRSTALLAFVSFIYLHHSLNRESVLLAVWLSFLAQGGCNSSDKKGMSTGVMQTSELVIRSKEWPYCVRPRVCLAQQPTEVVGRGNEGQLDKFPNFLSQLLIIFSSV